MKNFKKASILLIVGFMISSSLYGKVKKSDAAKKSQQKVKPQIIEGTWLRSDGGYALKLSDLEISGEMKAFYFNPKAINVSKSEWKYEDKQITIFVEFDDVNYRGSKYSLKYFPKEDKLVGTYYQAVHKVTYQIAFVRQKDK